MIDLSEIQNGIDRLVGVTTALARGFSNSEDIEMSSEELANVFWLLENELRTLQKEADKIVTESK